MSVNLYKYRDELISSWKQVTDDKDATTWALYGYANNTNDLKLLSKGSGGLEELADQFDETKILYAFARVVDPNTELIKFVFISWQGEGAVLSRKGLCANHVRDINGFFRGAHISINARCEDEVEPSVIIEKVAKTSVTKLSLKERSDPNDVPSRPIGSNYQRIQPAKEINSSERETFWHKQQEEERKRKIEERERMDEERKKQEEVEKLREMKEAKERENAILRKETELAKRREEEKNAKNDTKKIITRSCPNDDVDPDEERIKRAEALKKSRADEARNLISGSNIRNARALFEQNTSTGQLTKPPLPKPIRTSVNKLAHPFSPSNTADAPVTNGSKKVTSDSKISDATEGSSPDCSAAKNHSDEKVSTPANNVDNKVNHTSTPHCTSNVLAATAVAGAVATTAVISNEQRDVNESNSSPDKPQSSPITHNLTSSIISGTNFLSDEVNNRNLNKNNFNSSSLYPNESTARQEIHNETDDDDEEEEEEEEDGNSSYLDDPRVAAALSAAQLQQRLYEHPVDHTLEDIAEECEDDEGNLHCNDTRPIKSIAPDGKSPKANGICARALYDYQAADETEISFDPDDLITHIDLIDPGWYQGMAPDGTYGLFPANYVEILEE